MQGGRLIETVHSSQHYRTVFDQRTGFFVRKEDLGWPEPTWSADGPELIDLSITNFCERGCDFCYRDTKRNGAIYMGIDEIVDVVSQAQDCGTLQIALGGGNPNQHPQFIEILRIIREHNIIPSYTTNGDGLSNEVLSATADYCGAMAISFYPPYDEGYYEGLLTRIKEFGITVNLHVIINNDTLNYWISWLRTPPAFLRLVNAVIFLNYKPIKGAYALLEKKRLRQFFDTAKHCSCVKIGFDSCSISGIVLWMNTPVYMVEPCEAARFSTFISEDMKMYPCSFMVDKRCYGDLRKNTLIDIWNNNEHFKGFRQDVTCDRCIGCGLYETCRGGCRMFPDINFCQWQE